MQTQLHRLTQATRRHVAACDARKMSQLEMERRWEIEGLGFCLIGWAIETLADRLFVEFTHDERPAMIVSTIMGIIVTAAATCQPPDLGDVRTIRISCQLTLDEMRAKAIERSPYNRATFADYWLGLPFRAAARICAAVCHEDGKGPRRVIGAVLFGLFGVSSNCVLSPDLATLFMLLCIVLGFKVGPTLLPARKVRALLPLTLSESFVPTCMPRQRQRHSYSCACFTTTISSAGLPRTLLLCGWGRVA